MCHILAQVLQGNSESKTHKGPHRAYAYTARPCSKCVTYVYSFNLTSTLFGKQYSYPHFIDEKSEAQRNLPRVAQLAGG